MWSQYTCYVTPKIWNTTFSIFFLPVRGNALHKPAHTTTSHTNNDSSQDEEYTCAYAFSEF